MKSLLLLLFILNFASSAFAEASISKKERCFNQLQSELKKFIEENPDFIQLQTTITAMKLSQEVLKRKNLKSQTLESYLENIIGPKSQKYMQENEKKLISLYQKYAKEEEVLESSNLLENLKEQGFSSDDDIRKLMIGLEEIDAKSFPFEEKDFAIAWYLNETANASGYNNNILSNVVRAILDFDVFDKEAFQKNNERISKTLAHAQAKLSGELAVVRKEVLSKYKKDCLDLFDAKTNENSSNESIFSYCGEKDLEVLDLAFTNALLEIQGKLIPQIVGFEEPENLKSNNDKRNVQDEINALSSDKKRVIAFQKSALNPLRDHCQHYAVVDKKQFKTEIYNNDGGLVTSIDSIVGSNRKDDKRFNPDASLQLFSNGTYTRTTSAGIFHVMKVGDERKKNNYYKEEFNNKVIVLGKMINSGNEVREEEEKILAIHGVPNAEWIGSDGKVKKLGNKKERMLSFEKNWDKKLSTGCVNLEAYTFDIVEELVHANCPIYILPEDKDNYFYVKNYEMNYSTSKEKRFTGEENSQIYSGNELTEDTKNFNRYNFTEPSKKVNFTEVKGSENQFVSDFLENKEAYLKEYKYIESDDVELSLSLVLSQGLEGEEAKKEFRRINKYLNDHKFHDKFQLSRTDSKKSEILSSIPHEKRNNIIEKSKEVICK